MSTSQGSSPPPRVTCPPPQPLRPPPAPPFLPLASMGRARGQEHFRVGGARAEHSEG